MKSNQKKSKGFNLRRFFLISFQETLSIHARLWKDLTFCEDICLLIVQAIIWGPVFLIFLANINVHFSLNPQSTIWAVEWGSVFWTHSGHVLLFQQGVYYTSKTEYLSEESRVRYSCFVFKARTQVRSKQKRTQGGNDALGSNGNLGVFFSCLNVHAFSSKLSAYW